jgi:Flp pilus assembly protein TadG
MNMRIVSFRQRLITDERGQVLPWLVLGMTMMVGATGMSIDVGHAYVVHAQLQNDANAAALAAAGEVYVSQSQTVNSTTEADLYSGSSGDENADSHLGTVNTSVSSVCLNSLQPTGVTCTTGSPANAIKVKESTSVPTYLLGVLGISSIPVVANATATMGGIAQPWNVAVIEDATGSMSAADTNCGGISEFQCALNGIQELLSSTNPCPAGKSSCTTAQANVRVSLWTFPNIITADLPMANACSGKTYTEPLPYAVHTLPLPSATSYSPLTYDETINSKKTTWTASYEVTWGASDADANGFVSDYYAPSDSSTFGLNASSSIVQAVGYGGTASGSKVGCLPISYGGVALNGATNGTGTSTNITPNDASATVNTTDVGEGITYYAAVIYAAQSALVAEQKLYPGSKNAMILLSDGQANTQWIYFPQGTVSPSGSDAVGKTNTATPSTIDASSSGYSTLKTTPNTSALNAYHLSTVNAEATGTISGLYPDFIDECQQAITAAQAATTAGTVVYAVAYGAEDSGCASGGHPDDYTDVTLVATGANAPFTLSTLTPCVTMENIASSLNTFYSDYLQSGSGVSTTCVDNAHTVTALVDIFASISTNFTTPRLIPNSAT